MTWAGEGAMLVLDGRESQQLVRALQKWIAEFKHYSQLPGGQRPQKFHNMQGNYNSVATLLGRSRSLHPQHGGRISIPEDSVWIAEEALGQKLQR